jgi:5,10-methylenetetrahydromethanopterin reductase
VRIGIFARQLLSFGHDPTVAFSPEAMAAEARMAVEDDLSSYWLPNQFDIDSFALVAGLAAAAPELELGVAVAPVWLRSPIQMAQAAATASLLSNGRFTLGLGIEHRIVVESLWGMSFEGVVDHLEEYLEVIDQLLASGNVKINGVFYRLSTERPRHSELQPPVPPIVLGALGPRMLALAGSRTSGTATWFAGPRAIRDHIAPRINEAAIAAGRPNPRVIAFLPIVVTEDEDSTRQRIHSAFDAYEDLPSYRDMLNREGTADAGSVALVGAAARVADGLAALADAGATDFGAIHFSNTPAEYEATRQVLRDAARMAASDSR